MGEPDEEGRRSLQLHSRPEGDPEAEWARNASGALAQPSSLPRRGLSAWPPEGAEPIEVGSLYEELAEAGFEYGPIFQGLRAAWRRGEELFAEVELGEEAPGAFAIHPALLDAALHASSFAEPESEARLPFSWSGVQLHGASGSLRVRLTPAGKDGFALLGADAAGTPLISIERLALRPLEPGALPSRPDTGGLALSPALARGSPPQGAEPIAEPWHCEPQGAADLLAGTQDSAERGAGRAAAPPRRAGCRAPGPWR